MIKIHEISRVFNTLQPTKLFEIMTFAGGEPHISFKNGLQVDGGEFVIEGHIDSFNELGMVLVANDALRREGAYKVSFYCPYLPGARQDRGAPLTCKVYADVINSAGFDRVVCIDPHSDVMPALVNNLSVAHMHTEYYCDVQTPGDSPLTVVCPDGGATKRTEAFAARFSLPIAYARKHRDMATGNLSGFSCEAIPEDHDVVIVDDICDGGGTFLGLADVIGKPREKMRLFTTHGIYSKGVYALSQKFGKIACTDSFPHDREDLIETSKISIPTLF